MRRCSPQYAEAYARGWGETGERHSYLSRASDGAVLYATHHFTYEELHKLLEAHGFSVQGLCHRRHRRRPPSMTGTGGLTWLRMPSAPTVASSTSTGLSVASLASGAGRYKEREASSRRPEERAWFLYAVATARPPSPAREPGPGL
jgi:hypothetical protein